MKVKSLSRARLLVTPWTAATRLHHPWDFPGKSTGLGCHGLLQFLYCSNSLFTLYPEEMIMGPRGGGGGKSFLNDYNHYKVSYNYEKNGPQEGVVS